MPPVLRRPARVTALALVTGLLAACANPPERASFACPRVAIVDGLHETAVIENDQVVGRAELESYRGSCTYDGEAISSTLRVDLAIEGGPGADGENRRYPLFVAVLDENAEILARREFGLGAAPRAGTTESRRRRLSQEIGLGAEEEPGQYTYLLGFANAEPETIDALLTRTDG